MTNAFTDWLTQLPRQTLGHWPTPLVLLPRLSAELDGPRIWLKRDDCSGLATGGNKTRKLEYLLGAALAQGTDTIVTYGAVQSNHARQTAAACASVGLQCHLILSQRVDWPYPAYNGQGNVFLDSLLGAHVHQCEVADTEMTRTKLLAQLEDQGARVYEIPAGGSAPLGALGYANCVLELAQQTEQLGIQPKTVLHASASCGTQTGLVYASERLQCDWQVLGINVYHPDPATLVARITSLLEKIGETYPDQALAKIPDIHVNHAYMGSAYGQPTEAGLKAIRWVAGLEGVLFDPVYSGKALAALIDQIDLGNFSHTDDVILIHTGGVASLAAYVDAFK